MKLLIVEDQQAIRNLLAEMLSQEGHLVTIQPNGASAVAFLNATLDLDVAIIDWILPDIVGEDLLRHVMDHPARPNCLLISGYELALEEFPSAWRQRLAFLEKPFTPAMVRSALSGLRLRDGEEGGL